MDKFLGDDAVVSVGGFPFYYLFVCFFLVCLSFRQYDK